jgi:hypothetical protein
MIGLSNNISQHLAVPYHLLDFPSALPVTSFLSIVITGQQLINSDWTLAIYVTDHSDYTSHLCISLQPRCRAVNITRSESSFCSSLPCSIAHRTNSIPSVTSHYPFPPPFLCFCHETHHEIQKKRENLVALNPLTFYQLFYPSSRIVDTCRCPIRLPSLVNAYVDKYLCFTCP